MPASETEPPPSGGLSFARVLKEVGALPGLSSEHFGAVATILHQRMGLREGLLMRVVLGVVLGWRGEAGLHATRHRCVDISRPPPLVPPGRGSIRQRVYADWHVVGPVRLPSSRYMYVLIR